MTNQPTSRPRLRDKPQGESYQFTSFRCECGRENTVREYYAEWSDFGDGDSLDHHCECGAYYKKTGRIPRGAVTDTWFEEA